jgi:periplasmic protein TonB
MYESDLFETRDSFGPNDELERALRIAFVREAAPDDLISRVEQRLLDARPAVPVPGFRLLSIDTYSRWTGIWSMAAHAGALALIALLIFAGRKHTPPRTNTTVTSLDVQPYMPIAPKGPQMGGGGGGGSHDLLQTPKGRLPQLEEHPIVPPMVAVNDHPKLTQEPAIMMPKDIQLANNNMPNLGDPRTSVVGPASNGTGSMGGMGTGSSGGLGSGKGNGYGPGEGGGTGGGLYQVGGGVSAPELIYAPDPEFSDEARRAKYQGVCVVSLIVDAQGNPQRVEVVRHLGMGLDEKAQEAVKHYKFKPAMLGGRPVPVEVNVEVNFRIY